MRYTVVLTVVGLVALAPGLAGATLAQTPASDQPIQSPGIGADDGALLSGVLLGNHSNNSQAPHNPGHNKNKTDRGNGTGPGNATRGPVTGLPDNVAGFTGTRAITGRQASPPSLAGKIRVESQYHSNTSIDLNRRNAANYTLSITVTPHAQNVTFYVQQTAVTASQNINNLSVKVDNSSVAFGTTNASGNGWLAFEVDHFSTRQVSFTTESSDSDSGSSGGDTGNSPLPGTPDQFDGNSDGSINIGELGNAAAAYASGSLSIGELGDVAAAYASR